MLVVLDRSPELVEWAGARIPSMAVVGVQFAANAQAIGVAADDGNILGAVVFHDWAPRYRTIAVSAAAEDPRWLRCREAIAQMWRYAWDLCGVDKIWSATPAKNARALKFVWGLGFKKEAVLERHLGDDDLVISRILRTEWEAQRGRL
jgi:hypothetical protein